MLGKVKQVSLLQNLEPSVSTDVNGQGQAFRGAPQTRLTTEPQATVQPALGNMGNTGPNG